VSSEGPEIVGVWNEWFWPHMQPTAPTFSAILAFQLAQPRPHLLPALLRGLRPLLVQAQHVLR
jgi:hypothetical protein